MRRRRRRTLSRRADKDRKSGPCTGWEDRFSQVPNAWLIRCANAGLSATEWNVLSYVIARTLGDYDARRGAHGRPWVRLACSEIHDEIGTSAKHETGERRVRRALASLKRKRIIREYRPPRGRKPAGIGPDPLMCSLTLDTLTLEQDYVEAPVPTEPLSELQRKAVEGFAGLCVAPATSEA
jgi:hypothetical protein